MSGNSHAMTMTSDLYQNNKRVQLIRDKAVRAVMIWHTYKLLSSKGATPCTFSSSVEIGSDLSVFPRVWLATNELSTCVESDLNSVCQMCQFAAFLWHSLFFLVHHHHHPYLLSVISVSINMKNRTQPI